MIAVTSRRQTIAAFVTSFVILGVFGCFVITSSWIQFSPLVRFRCVGYLLILGGVHYLGFRYRQRQLRALIHSDQIQDNLSGSDVINEHLTRFFVWLSVALTFIALLRALML